MRKLGRYSDTVVLAIAILLTEAVQAVGIYVIIALVLVLLYFQK